MPSLDSTRLMEIPKRSNDSFNEVNIPKILTNALHSCSVLTTKFSNILTHYFVNMESKIELNEVTQVI